MDQLGPLLAALQSPGLERNDAEAQLDGALKSHPLKTLAGLLVCARDAPDEESRVFSLVLYRRLAFRPAGEDDNPAELLTKQTWDKLLDKDRAQLQEKLLLNLLVADKRRERERGAICDAVSATVKADMDRQNSWPALSSALASMFSSTSLALREACFRIYGECTGLLQNESAETVTAGFTAGLRDDSPGVRLAALSACCALLGQTDAKELARYGDLVVPMLQVLPPLVQQRAEARLTSALLSLIELGSTPKVPSRVFKPHLSALLEFSMSIFVPSPFSGSRHYDSKAMEESVRQSAIELLVSLAETAPSMCKSHPDFVNRLVPALMQVMTEVEEEADWLEQEVIQDNDDDSIAVAAESALDRVARALGDDVFQPFLQTATTLVQSSKWQDRHAGLSAIAAVAEGTSTQMIEQLHHFVNVSIQRCKDQHPRVRYAAVFALGQMCTDLHGTVQDEHGADVLRAFGLVMSGRESRLQAFAAAALVNFFSGADEVDGLDDVLSGVFDKLLGLLQRGTDFVKANALEAMTLLARTMEERFNPLYARIMPDLLNLLETDGDEYETLRAKALDCTATIGAAVDSFYFAPDAERLLDIMHKMHVTLPEDDEDTRPYLLNAYSLLALTVGPEAFAPYLNDVFPRLLEVANRKTEATIGGDEGDEEEGWETVEVNGELMAIRTSGLEEKADAVGNLVLLTQAIGSGLPAEALEQVLRTGVSLLGFYFDLRVRESAAALLAVGLKGLSGLNLPTAHKAAAVNTCSDAFAKHISQDTDPELLSTLIESWTASVKQYPGLLSDASRQTAIKALEAQLTQLVQREQERSHASAGLASGGGAADEDDLLELEEMAESEAVVYYAINGALRWLLSQYGVNVPAQPFLPFLNLMTASTIPREFALRLWADLATLGDEVYPMLREHAPKVLEAINDEEPTTQRIAAYAVGVAAQHGPTAFGEVVAAAIERLFGIIGPVDTSDNDALLVRDNAVSAVGKIIRYCPAVDADALLPRWVQALPVFVDGEEMTPTNDLLIELIARNHPSVSPTSGVASHVLKSFVATLQADELPATLEAPVSRALKAYVAQVPGASVDQMPEDVRDKLSVV